MATVIESLPAARSRYTKYRFSLWMDGQVWRLSRGKDYANYRQLRYAAYAYGKRHGIRVFIRKMGSDFIAIQGVKRGEQ